MQSFRKFSLVCLLSLTVIGGCNQGIDIGTIVAENNKSAMQKIANALMLYQVRNGKAASSEEDLCDFIENNGTIEKNLRFMNIDRDGFRDYFINERDGEPFFVRYGVYLPDRAPSQGLVFEMVGVEGVRKVGWSDSTVTEVTDDQEYAKLKKGKSKDAKFVDPELPQAEK